MAEFNPLKAGEVDEAYIDFLLENTPYRVHGVDTRPILKEHFLNGVSLHQFINEDNDDKPKVYWNSLSRQKKKIQRQHQVFCEGALHALAYLKK